MIMKNANFRVTLLTFLVSVSSSLAQITNVHFERSVDLMEQGSNLITFQNTIQFTNDNQER